MRISICILGTLLACLSACKARSPERAGALAGADAPDDTSASAQAAAALTLLEQHLGEAEPLAVAFAGGQAAPLDDSSFALVEPDDTRYLQNLMDMADALKRASDDQLLGSKETLRYIAAEIETLGKSRSSLTKDENERLDAALVRIRRLLATLDKPLVKPAPVPVKPQEPDDNAELYCKNLGNASWIPAIKATNENVGVPSQKGGQGYTVLENCENVIKARRNGLVCTFASKGSLNPVRVANGLVIGAKRAFATVAGCIEAVVGTTDMGLVCVVDNSFRPGRYERWDLKTGAFHSKWYKDVESCYAGVTISEARLRCQSACAAAEEECTRNSRPSDTNATIRCYVEHGDCQDACPQR